MLLRSQKRLDFSLGMCYKQSKFGEEFLEELRQ